MDNLLISNKLYLFQISNMSNFFTPVQVPSTRQGLADHYEIQKYKNDPFMPTPIKIESFGDHRRKISQWLKSMPVAMRIDKLMFTNKQFACLLISMYEKIEDRSGNYLRQFGISFCQKQGFKIVEERFNRKPNIALIEAQQVNQSLFQRLIKSILIANRYSRFDSVTVDSTLASDINYMFQLFDVIQNGVSYELTPNNYQKYSNQEDSQLMFYNPSDHDNSVTKSLGTWFVQVIKKKVSLQYYKQCVKFNNQTNQFKHLKIGKQQSQTNYDGKKREMTEIFKYKSKIFKKHWKFMTHIQRQQFIQKIINTDIRQILGEYRQIIKVSNESFPNIKYSHPYCISKFVQALTLGDGQFLLNQLVFTKLQDCSFQIATYKYQIMIQIQCEIDKKKKQQTHIFLRKKLRKQAKVKKSQNYNYKQHIIKSQKMFLQEQTISQKDKTRQTETKISQEHTANLNRQNETRIKKKNKKVKKQKNNLNNNYIQGCKQQSQTTNDQDDESEKSQIYESLNLQKELAEKDFDKVLKQFFQKIRNWNKHQQLALNRIAYLLSIYNLSYQVFGSFANGLVTSSSDIDISVDPTIIHFFYGAFCTYRQKIILALQFLQSYFQQFNWIGNINLISTASVPVLVFQIDLSIAFGDPKDLNYNMGKNKKGPKVCVDISIQPFANMVKQCGSHLGIDSTNLVKEWMGQFGELKQLTCFFKHILSKYNLNKSFTGGLSSYALTTMIYSFLKNDKNRIRKSKMDLILQFCQFVINLNQNCTVIQPANLNPIQIKLADKLTVLNYLNGKNLTQNCYRFGEIKIIMETVKSTLKQFQTDNLNKQYNKNLRNLLLQ